MNVFSLLPECEERLLQKTKAHLGDKEYWYERFESLSFQEEALLRSAFKDLKAREMISCPWADNAPHLLRILIKGDSYFELKDEWKKEKQRESRKTWAIGLLAAFGGLALTIIAQLIIRWMG